MEKDAVKTDKAQSAVSRRGILQDAGTVFVMLIAFSGGTLGELFGSSMASLLDYAVLAFEIAVMLLSSGNSFFEIRVFSVSRRQAPVMFLIFFIFLDSMVVTTHPGDQFVTCFHMASTAVFAVWLSARYDEQKLLELSVRAQEWLLVLTFLYLLKDPAGSFEEADGMTCFTGLMQAKNVAASEFSFVITLQLVLLFLYRREKKPVPFRFTLTFVIQIVLLALCRAVGAVLSCIVVCLYLWLYDRNHIRTRMHIGIVYVAVSIGFLIFAETLLPFFEPVLNFFGKDVTLTHRTELWAQILDVMTQHHTFFGYGYGMFWRDDEAMVLVHRGFSRNSFFGNFTTGSHNELLEWWISVGLVGLGLYFGILIASARDTKYMTKNRYLTECAIHLFLLLNGLTERKFGGTNDYNTLYRFLALALLFCAPEKKKWTRHIDPAVQEETLQAMGQAQSEESVKVGDAT